MRPGCQPPTPRESGCYLARWRLHDALIKPHMYLYQRCLEQSNARSEPCGLSILDEMNPRFFSNNMILPYLVAVWEEYFRASFIAILRYSSQREDVLKKANLKKYQLESIAAKALSIEEAVADTLSFQRPQMITSNFRILDKKLDLEGAMKKPYRKRNKSLFSSIEERVEDRNEFVHSGRMDTRLTDKKLKILINDFEEAVDRCYQEISERYEFEMELYHW